MNLSFDEKRKILNSIPGIVEYQVVSKPNEYNYKYLRNNGKYKAIAVALNKTGFVYLWGKDLVGYNKDDRGWINAKNFNEIQFKDTLIKVINMID